MVLWALSLLAVFAVQISAMTQDKIAFLARIERTNILRNAAKSGIFKAMAIIRNEPFKNKARNLLERSLTLYYNSIAFRNLDFGQAQVSISSDNGEFVKVYGVTDETRRLNLNIADRESIRKLLLAIGIATEDEANVISAGIFDWRENGESELKGFSSDEFYENLEFPYPQKKGKYETLDELKLVEGVSEKIYAALLNYVTIYGGEEINMNTVSWPVLMALGFSEEQAKTALAIRYGADGREGTLDDFFFEDRNMFIEKIIQALAMKSEEGEEFRAVAQKVKFVDDAHIFRIESRAQLDSRKEDISIVCVFDATGDKIIAWKER